MGSLRSDTMVLCSSPMTDVETAKRLDRILSVLEVSRCYRTSAVKCPITGKVTPATLKMSNVISTPTCLS